MKALFIAMALIFSVGTFSTAAFANPYHEKMRSCNAESKGKKGQERKDFMKACLSEAKEIKNKQHEKMKTCNMEAKGKKGQERKDFMKSCLSSDAATAPVAAPAAPAEPTAPNQPTQ